MVKQRNDAQNQLHIPTSHLDYKNYQQQCNLQRMQPANYEILIKFFQSFPSKYVSLW